MKKLLMTIAVLGCAAAVTAQTVTSQNIVGYNKTLKLAGDLQLAGVSWSDSNLNDILSKDQFTGDALYGNADKLILWDETAVPQTYVTYGLYSLVPYGGTLQEWRLSTAWGVAGDVNPLIPAGTGLWIQSPNSSSDIDLILTGEVPTTATVTNQIVSGLQILCSPFTCDVTLNQLKLVESGAYGDALYGNADKVITWDDTAVPPGYVTYGLYSTVPYGGTLTEWRLSTAWGIVGPVNPTINLGKGFWYSSKNSFTWVMDNPYFSSL